MTQFELEALGTHWWISAENLDQARIKEQIVDFENQFSRFRPDSELSQLNNQHHLEPGSAELRQLLKIGLQYWRQTSGLFNISVGAELEKSGYGPRPDKLGQLSSNLTNDILLAPNQIRTAPHVRIDLGGLGKGYLIDLLGQTLGPSSGFIINGGGDILVGNQTEKIYLEHPQDSQLQIGSVELTNEALASSSNQKRVWNQSGRRQQHIIAPQGEPVNQPLSVHVRAKTALMADIFATTLMIASHHQRRDLARRYNFEFCEIRPDLTYWQTDGFGLIPNR